VATSSSPSSSAKRVAKLAQRGKGKKVRFQGGLLFPAAIIAVVVLGMTTILYARESRPDPGSFPPQVNDHWHAAIGFRVCDTWRPDIDDAKEETTIDPQTGAEQYEDEEYGLAGVHTHADGVIHYHPFSTRSVGKRARLGVLLDVYDIELSADRLDLRSVGDELYDVENGFQCNGEDAEIKVVAWDNYADTGNGQTYITDLPDVALRNDGMAFAIAVVPAGTEVPIPPWASNLPDLGAADSGTVAPTTVVGQTDGSVPATEGTGTDSTVPGDTTAEPGSTEATSDTTSGTGTTPVGTDVPDTTAGG